MKAVVGNLMSNRLWIGQSQPEARLAVIRKKNGVKRWSQISLHKGA